MYNNVNFKGFLYVYIIEREKRNPNHTSFINLIMTLEQKLDSAKKQLLKSGFQLCDIEDALQDVILKTLDKGQDLDTKPASWFAISAYRRAVDIHRHYGRTPLLADIEITVDDDQELIDALIDMNSTETNTVLLS